VGEPKKERPGHDQLECVADGTHETHVTPMLHDARVTPRSGALRFWSLHTQLEHDCAMPVGCAPEPEPAPFVEVGLPFFAKDDGDEFPPGDDEEPLSDSWPVIFAGEARFDTGAAFSFSVTDIIEPELG
jgi:hypothetical protein